MIRNDRDDGETILKPEGWFKGLTCRDASGTGLTAEKMDVTHADHKALSEDEQNWIKSIKPLNGGKKVVFRFKPESLSSEQTTRARRTNTNSAILEQS